MDWLIKQRNEIEIMAAQFKIYKSNIYIWVSFFLLFGVTAIYVFNNGYSQIGFYSDDSIYYKEQSLEYCAAPLLPIFEATKEGFSLLNWSTIVSIGAFSCMLSEENSDSFIMSLNVMLLLMVLYVYKIILKEYNFSANDRMWFFLLFCVQVHMIPQLASLNKEIISYLIISLYYLYYSRGNTLPILLLTLFSAFIKFQFLFFGLLLVVSMRGVGFWKILIASSLLLPVIQANFDINYLNAELYYSRYDIIRTQNTLVFLSKITEYPFGFLIAMPVKMAITMLSGFSFSRIISISDMHSFLYQLSALIFSIFSILACYKFARYRLSLNSKLMSFIMFYSLLICSLPFVQLRYYFPLFPLLIIFFLIHKKYCIDTSSYIGVSQEKHFE
jgi:hypothetical protein